ncbi:MAG: choice-of-anchor D domain-containing protein, partial [Planctomycetes bacterium]|nr:choice-of-anchor D domain-containing protein [Planctomycetota bacterium]
TANLDVGMPAFAAATTEYSIQATGFPATLAPGNSITFSITFDPTLQGTQTAVVQFTHNDLTTASPFRLNVTGDGILNAPLIEVHETSAVGPGVASSQTASIGGGRDCGSIDVSAGATSPITIVIVNSGTLPLNLTNLTLTGPNAADFILGTGSFNGTVTPGNSTQVDVSFDPTLGGMKDANLQFNQDDPAQPDPYIVPVRGTAIDPAGVQITTGSLPAGLAGAPYGPVQLAATQGSSPYTWSLYSGTLPAGVNLSATGLIDGTPTGLGGTYNVIIRVTDQNGATDEQQYAIGISSLYTGKGRAKDTGGCVADSGANGWAIALLALLGLAGLVYRRRSA